MRINRHILAPIISASWLMPNVSALGASTELVSPNEEASGLFGISVSGIPDVNGDGLGDVIVGAFQEDPGTSPNEAGRAYLFSGDSGTMLRTLLSPNEEVEGYFGVSVSGISDLDGDGRGDVIVGASQEDPGGSPSEAGRVYILSGATGSLLQTLVSPNEEMDGQFGISVSAVPDVDGDAYEDVVVGAYWESPGSSPPAAGRAYIFSGATGTALSTLASPNEEGSAYFGISVSGIPDVDGDARGDVIVGTWLEDPGDSPQDAGSAYIFSGATGTALWNLVSPNQEQDGRFGLSVSGIPDVDGDGRGDVIVGAKWEDPGSAPSEAGRAYIFSGASGTVLRTLVSPNEQADGYFGCSVSGVADVNGDGRGDVIIGAWWEGPGGSPSEAGRAYVFSGANGDLLRTLASPNEQTEGHFGEPVSGIRDANGDGLGDVVVGAREEEPGSSPQDAGRAYIFTGPEPVPSISFGGLALLAGLALGVVAWVRRRG